MKEKINFYNPYSFSYLWNHDLAKNYLTDLINQIISENDNYELLNFYNQSFNDVRSYVILKSKQNIVFIDFNIRNNNYLLKYNLNIFSYLKYTNKKKKIFMIIFNDFKGEDNSYNNIYDIYNYPFSKKIINLLKQMDEETYKLYLHENMLKLNLLSH